MIRLGWDELVRPRTSYAHVCRARSGSRTDQRNTRGKDHPTWQVLMAFLSWSGLPGRTAGEVPRSSLTPLLLQESGPMPILNSPT
jgi:hypothetical protein